MCKYLNVGVCLCFGPCGNRSDTTAPHRAGQRMSDGRARSRSKTIDACVRSQSSHYPLQTRTHTVTRADAHISHSFIHIMYVFAYKCVLCTDCVRFGSLARVSVCVCVESRLCAVCDRSHGLTIRYIVAPASVCMCVWLGR